MAIYIFIHVNGLKLHEASTNHLLREGSLVPEGVVSCTLATSVGQFWKESDYCIEKMERVNITSDYLLNDGARIFSQNNAFSPGFPLVTTFGYKVGMLFNDRSYYEYSN